MRRRRAIAAPLLTVALAAIPMGMAASGCAPAAPLAMEDVDPGTVSFAPDAMEEEMRSLRAQQLFVRGMTQAQTGDEGAALDLYAQALRLAPDTPAILAALAERYEANGDYQAARYHLTRAHDLAPENIYYALQLAGVQAELGERAQAASLYAAILEKAPERLDARYDLARLYAMEGETAKAAAAYERILQENAGDRAARRRLLNLYEQLGDGPNAERILADMLKDDPQNPDLRRTMAEIRLKQGRYEEASDAFLRILEQNTQDAQWWIYAARTLQDGGGLAAAGVVAEKGLALFPNALALRKIAGAAAMAGARNAEAVRHFEAAARIAAEDAYGNEAERGSLRSTLGALHARMGDERAARQAYEAALRHLREAAKQPNASAETLERLGDAYEALGRGESAAEAWRRALEIDPNRPEARRKLDRK